RIGMSPIDCRRDTAAGVLDASRTPSCTSPEGVTALYWKNGIGAEARSILARDAQDFLDCGGPRERLAEPILEHGLHALGDRRGADLARRRVPHDERAQRIRDRHHLDDAHASEIAGAGAFVAADRAVQRDRSLRLEAPQSHLLDNFGKRGMRLAAFRAERA